jgi:short-subunit dehydrogenase
MSPAQTGQQKVAVTGASHGICAGLAPIFQ